MSGTRGARSRPPRPGERRKEAVKNRASNQDRALAQRKLVAAHAREVMATRARAGAPISVPGVRQPVTRAAVRTKSDASRFRGTETLNAT